MFDEKDEKILDSENNTQNSISGDVPVDSAQDHDAQVVEVASSEVIEPAETTLSEEETVSAENSSPILETTSPAADFNTTQSSNPMQNSPDYPNKGNYNSFYKENFKKTNQSSNAWKYVLVSVVSSVIGGIFIAVMLLVVAPVIQPGIREWVSEIFPNAQLESTSPGYTELKKVEIVQNGETAITSVAEKVGPSVVGIKTTYQNSNALFGVQSEGGEGSGIIYSSDGYILTNHHVIEGAINDSTRTFRNDATVEVYLPSRIDKPYKAILKGYDSKTDLAVLKIEATNLPAIELGDSDQLKVGEPAIAIGNPGGLEYMGSVTSGIISGLNRTVELENGKKIKLIQTDAAINPGNSGGALVNIEGKLIGVNSVKMVATGFESLGFAIPVNDVKTIANELIKNTYISKPYLGVSIDERYTEEIAKQNNMPMGVYVADVEMMGAAQKAGVRSGDVITKFNGKAISSFDELEEQKNKFKPGDKVTVEVYRDKETKTFTVTLGETK